MVFKTYHLGNGIENIKLFSKLFKRRKRSYCRFWDCLVPLLSAFAMEKKHKSSASLHPNINIMLPALLKSYFWQFSLKTCWRHKWERLWHRKQTIQVSRRLCCCLHTVCTLERKLKGLRWIPFSLRAFPLIAESGSLVKPFHRTTNKQTSQFCEKDSTCEARKTLFSIPFG